MAIDTTGSGAFPAATRIAGNTRTTVKGLWFFTVLWNLVSAPMLVVVPQEIDRQPLAWLGYLFPIVGTGLIGWAVLATARAQRFGQTWLDTSAGAARPGHTWRATILARLPRPDGQAGEPVRLKLTCLQRTISRRGSTRDERERIVWREEIELPWTRIAFNAEGAAIPVEFGLPEDALETTAVGKGEGVLWVLTAEAALPGVNLKEDFDVPVRRSGPGGSENTPPRTAPAAHVSLDDLARAGIRVEPAAGGMAFRFAPMRNPSFALGVTAFTAVWTGALWVQWSLGFPWVFLVVTGLFDMLLAHVTLDLWLGTTTVAAGAGELRVQQGLLGAGRTRVISATDIAALDLHISMQTQGRHGTPYYSVRARLRNGRKATLGGGIRSKRQAEWLAAQMRAAIGLK